MKRSNCFNEQSLLMGWAQKNICTQGIKHTFCGLWKLSRSFFIDTLKGQCHKILDFWFFHESVSSKPLGIPLGPLQIFSKILGDIRSSRCTPVVVDTGGKCTKSQDLSSLLLFPRCRQNFPLVSLIPGANLPPASLIPVMHLDLRISPQIFEKI
jgi:hypothetical protein